MVKRHLIKLTFGKNKQGEWTQTVTSNLALTERENTIRLLECHHIWCIGSAVMSSVGKVVKSARRRQLYDYFGNIWCF